MKKKIILLSISIFISLIFCGCTDLNVPDINDELSKKMTIITFSVVPSVIELGDTANLSWIITGSDTIVNIDNGIGDVSLTGYRIISPTETITYVLTATNSTSTKNAITQIFVTLNQSEENNSQCGDNNNQTILTVQEVYQNQDSYIGKRITVVGYYFISLDGPCLLPANTVVVQNPIVKIILDETTLNSAIQKTNISLSSRLKYYVLGIIQQIPIDGDFGVKIIIESIKEV